MLLLLPGFSAGFFLQNMRDVKREHTTGFWPHASPLPARPGSSHVDEKRGAQCQMASTPSSSGGTRADVLVVLCLWFLLFSTKFGMAELE